VTVLAALSCLSMGFLTGVPAAVGSPSVRQVQIVNCPGFTRVLCGTIRVPLYRDLEDSPFISVSFRVYTHTDESLPPLEPIVAIEGGPGYPSIGSAASYRFMIGPLHQRHDMIVMDQRGTGSSDPIDCPSAQQYAGLSRPEGIAAAVRRCATLLGGTANAFGTVAMGDDLADILQALGIARADVYGDSYGSFAAQSFALHHPELVRSLVLDGTYNGSYNPFEVEDTGAMRHAWTALCARSGDCPGGPILAQIAAFARYLQAHPLTGMSRDADGNPVHVDMTASAFAELVYDATYIYSPFRDLPAAMQAFRRGDSAPMLRLGAEDYSENAPGGSPSAYSDGDLDVVSCIDYPTAWKISSDPAQRRVELAHAISRLAPNVFYPFSKPVYLRSYVENELVSGCLDWPSRTIIDPPFPPGVHYPDTPVLILNGEFDQATPVFDARMVQRSWPNTTFVEVPNTNHVTAEGDLQRCTAVVLQHFVQSFTTGGTACVKAMPPVSVVPDFPAHLSEAPIPAATPGSTGTAQERRAAWVASEVVADALSSWQNLMYGNHGHGLYGGAFFSSGTFDSTGPVALRFKDDRFTRDLAVSGSATWERSKGLVLATLRLRGPGAMTGLVHVAWRTGIFDWSQPASVSGWIDGHPVSVHMPAPWVPQS
jgi:pimeloyl-ACP methyl ester carboxylesterase